jgi:uncharacterized OB-fold protein
MKIYNQENLYYRLENNTPYLIGSKCKQCGYVAFPKKVVCPACVTKGSMVEIQLSRRGRLDTFSVLHVGPPGFATPYVVGYVVLPEGPRVFSMIKGCQPSEDSLEIGQEMELTLGKIRHDEHNNEFVGYQFRPVNGD